MTKIPMLLFFRENKTWHFMWFANLADNSQEISSFFFWKKSVVLCFKGWPFTRTLLELYNYICECPFHLILWHFFDWWGGEERMVKQKCVFDHMWYAEIQIILHLILGPLLLDWFIRAIASWQTLWGHCFWIDSFELLPLDTYYRHHFWIDSLLPFHQEIPIRAFA